MKHCDEDTLYKFILELLDKSEITKITNHIKECKYCSDKFKDISTQIDLLGSYDPIVEKAPNPIKPQRTYSSTWLKRAAVLIVGMFIGYSVSDYVKQEKIIIVGQAFTPKNTSLDTLRFIDCPNVDIFSKY